MSTDTDNTVRGPEASGQVWGVTPVSDHNSSGQHRRGQKRKVKRKKDADKKPAGKKTQPADPDPEDESGQGRESADGEHTVDVLA